RPCGLDLSRWRIHAGGSGLAPPLCRRLPARVRVHSAVRRCPIRCNARAQSWSVPSLVFLLGCGSPNASDSAVRKTFEPRRRAAGRAADGRRATRPRRATGSGRTICPRSRKSKGRSGNAYKVLALQVELSLPRLIASRVEARRCLRAFGRGSGPQGQSNHSTPRSRRPRVFPDPVRLGLLAEPEPLADLRHEASHGPTLRFGCFSREPKLAW